MSANVRWVRKYEFIEAPAVITNTAGVFGMAVGTETVAVMARCNCPTTLYHCVTHGAALHNLGQVEMHTEGDGDHLLAAYCTRHRVYMPPHNENGAQPVSQETR